MARRRRKDQVKKPRTRQRLSEHFVVEEFDCHDGTNVKPEEYDGLKYLCRNFLEPLHDKFGVVHVNSGFRTVSWNARIGGEPGSYHIYNIHGKRGQAVDFTCARGNPRDWHQFMNRLRNRKRDGKGGLGLYSNFVHFDTRDYKSDWTG